MLLGLTDDRLVFTQHAAADCEFDTYDAAAHAILVALGAADGSPSKTSAPIRSATAAGAADQAAA